MFKTNEYFDGKVKSIAFKDEKSEATIGVMAAGEYEFGTVRMEVMTIISGGLNILMPGCEEWHKYDVMESFQIKAGKRFKVKVEQPTTYICRYYDECGCNCHC